MKAGQQQPRIAQIYANVKNNKIEKELEK